MRDSLIATNPGQLHTTSFRGTPAIGKLASFALLVALACLAFQPVGAAEVDAASSSRQARDEAIRRIPINRLTPADRQRVSRVLVSPTVYRKLPTQVIQCDPSMYLFLVEHPEVIINTWQVMDVTDIQLDRASENLFRIDDGAGTRGTVEVLARGHDTHLLFCEGTYEGPLLNRKLSGRAVVLLRSDYVRETNGKQYVTCRLDAFLQLDQAGAEVFAKTFQPVMGPVADHNFRETAAFLQTVSVTAESNYEGMRRLANRLTAVHPDVRERFARLSEEVAVRAATVEPQVRVAENDAAAAAAAGSTVAPATGIGLPRPPSFRR